MEEICQKYESNFIVNLIKSMSRQYSIYFRYPESRQYHAAQ